MPASVLTLSLISYALGFKLSLYFASTPPVLILLFFQQLIVGTIVLFPSFDRQLVLGPRSDVSYARGAGQAVRESR